MINVIYFDLGSKFYGFHLQLGGFHWKSQVLSNFRSLDLCPTLAPQISKYLYISSAFAKYGRCLRRTIHYSLQINLE